MDNQKTVIGKDVIESLTLGMYEDSRFIYREYVQNAADQVDIAVETGVLAARREGKIDIIIDTPNRRIIIEDNATGIKERDVANILRNIARSTKDRRKNKGFRGIGRLGGLGYCDKLTFETSFKGESTKSIMIWDSKMLREILYDRSEKEEAADVIDTVTKFVHENEKANAHYFKVILEEVSNDLLLEKSEIKEYLEMVAPVPYGRSFLFRDEIKQEMKLQGLALDEYHVFVNSKPLFKPYTKRLYEMRGNEKDSYDEVMKLEFIHLENERKELVAWGWYSISNFKKRIPLKPNPAAGIRLRKGNIQIGSENCLIKLHKEQRGNFYFFGEIHAFHPELIPNARRDYFLENNATQELEKQLRDIFATTHYPLYHFASKVRSNQRKIDKFSDYESKYKKKKKEGFWTPDDAEEADNQFIKMKLDAKQASERLHRIQEKVIQDEESPKKEIFQQITKTVKKDNIPTFSPTFRPIKNPKILTDELEMTEVEKTLLAKILSIIDNALSTDLADNLKEKIKDELKQK